MTYPYLIQLAIDHPLLAFAMSWPLGLTLLSICWCVSTLITNAMAVTANAAIQSLSALVIGVRGYPPADKDTEDDDSLPPIAG